MRTSSKCLRDRHRGVNPEFARLVTRRADDAASLRRIGSDDNRFSTEIRVVELLDRREEGVHIDVHYDSSQNPTSLSGM